MLELVDHVAALTEHRDRDALDIGLTQTLMALFKPLEVAVFGVMSDARDQRWLPLTSLRQGGAVERFNALHADFRLLEPVQGVPHRWRCLSTHAPVEVESSARPARCVTCLPLSAEGGGDDAGVIELHSRNKLNAQDHEAAQRVLRVYRNMNSMFAYSERDALTGLLNRKSFDDTFYKSFKDVPAPQADESPASQRGAVAVPKRRVETGEVFWLAMVDVDHFKQVNDKFGHQIGDEVLILVARILKSTFRGYDRIYRFGGEEFVMLLRCPGHEAAVHAVERFRMAMEKYLFPQVGRITASVGVSEIAVSDTPEAVCERADQAVYFAKRNGRNRVCSYSELERQGLLQAEVKTGGVELF